MKLIKLNDSHYIICDDSEIKTGDWYYDSNDVESLIPIYQRSQQFADYSGCKKISHSTQPLELICCTPEGQIKRYIDCKGCDRGTLGYNEVKPLSLSEVKELLGIVDVEKSMWYERNLQNPYPLDSPSNTGFKKGFELGYYQALEDNKEKKYTEEDMRKAIDMSKEKHDYLYGYYWNKEQIIQSLQPKTEWEVEFVDGKLKLKQ